MRTAFPIAAADGPQGYPGEAASHWGEKIKTLLFWCPKNNPSKDRDYKKPGRASTAMDISQPKCAFGVALHLPDEVMQVTFLNVGRLGFLVARRCL